MSVNASNQTPILKTNHTNNSLLKRDEKNRIARLLSNIIGRDGVWVRHKANRIEIGLRDKKKKIHFLVIRDSENPDDQVAVSGGWWAYYEGRVRTQIDLSDGGAGTITDYSDYTAGISVTADGFIYLELDKDAGTLEAKFDEEIPDDESYKFRKIIASVTWDSGESRISSIKQNWTGGNILTETDQDKEHSWHFTPTGVGTGIISNALFYYQGEKQTIAESSTAITGTGPWNLTIGASHTHVYLEVDTTSTPSFTLKTGTSFPDAGSETRIYPILEFTTYTDANDCIEHQQSDIHLDIPPHKNGSNDYAALANNGGVIEWAYASNDYEVLQRKADDSIGFDWPRFNAGSV
jgi:hypothetical protein